MNSSDGRGKAGRRLLADIHKWIALVVGVLLIAQAGTGVILANQDVLLQVFHPETRGRAAERTADLDTLVARALAASPGSRLDRLLFTHQDAGVILARVRTDADRALHIVVLERQTATVLSSGGIWRYPTQLAERIHVSLMSGVAGQLVLLVEGLLLLTLSITGLILWWPKQHRYAEALTIHLRAPWRRVLRDFHLAPGAVMSLFFALSGLTGTLMVAEPLIKPVVAIVAPVLPELNPDLPPVEQGAQPLITSQAALERLQARFPDGTLRQVRVLADGRLIGVVMTAADAANPRAHHIAGVDRFTGELLVFSDGNDLPSGEAALSWILPIHNGDAYGPLRRPVITLVGLMLLGSSITGLAMWAVKPRRRRRQSPS